MSVNSASRSHAFDALPIFQSGQAQAVSGDSTACFDRQVPPFVDALLEHLYASIHATLGMFRFDGSIASASTYISMAGGRPTAVLLYRRERERVTVLNTSIELSQAEIERFARTIFRRYRDASVIVFNGIRHDITRLPYPVQRYGYLEDIVAELPPTPDLYFSSLGRNMRETIKRFQNRLKRTHPGFRFEVQVNDEANEDQIRDLYTLQRARIRSKNKTSTITDAEIERIITLVKERGLVTIATIDGKVCGGMVCWRAGDNFFMRTIAHDPQYDDLKLGTLCCYYTISECIVRGGKAFYFSPGRVLYKYRFLGLERMYDRVVLYRSPLHMLPNLGTVIRTAIAGRIRSFRDELLEAKSGDAPPARLSVRLFLAWRALSSAGSARERIAAARSTLRPAQGKPAGAHLRLSASEEAPREIRMRRKGASNHPAEETAGTETHAM
jgi:hypothetical protein